MSYGGCSAEAGADNSFAARMPVSPERRSDALASPGYKLDVYYVRAVRGGA